MYENLTVVCIYKRPEQTEKNSFTIIIQIIYN